MFVDETAEQKVLRAELRAYFVKLMTPEVLAEVRGAESGEAYRRVIRQMGKDGWLGIGWPVEYGGQGRSATEQLIFFEEAVRAGAPIPFVTLNTVGPAIMHLGSEAHKKQFLPGILSGEIHFAIGYSEPEAGTDLASLRTTAVRDGDDYVINGTKSFTSGADGADYIWLAARTDPNVPKHKGLTILIVDTKLPGFSVAPIRTVGDARTTMTYYDDVRVPVSMVVGEENRGWKLITAQLNHERVGLAALGSAGQGLFEGVVAWAKEVEDEAGRPVIEQPWVQMSLAEAYCLLEAMKLMNARMAWELEQGKLDPAGASAIKVYGTESAIEVSRLLLEVVGPVGAVPEGSPGAVLRGQLERQYRACQINTFGGGVNEIQREIVAMLGLGMPRGSR
ncbi:MAG: acyl-CoA dehydrogenase family protein [Deltaproteobacteria bacterium]|nr:acyl-CoA dehydrogenase family protein [Deltaproteobacteria bacterium]